MKKRHLLNILFLALLCGGCCIVNPYLSWVNEWEVCSEQRTFPKKNEFWITPISGQTNTLIRYDGVYVSAVSEEWYAGHTLYEFLRFWPNGTVYGSGREDILPDCCYAESFQSIHMGFFEIHGTNLWIEIYNPQTYVLFSGTVYDNQISLDKYLQRKHRSPARGPTNRKQTFTFLPIPGMTRQPDWSPTGMLHGAESTIRINQ